MGFALGLTQQQTELTLPEMLNESETQKIMKEQNPKSHVKAVLNVSEDRMKSALNFSHESKFRSAAQEVDVFYSLIIYADAYTRRMPKDKLKDRNHNLKKIEQTIFKQTRNMDAVTREMPFELRESVMPKITEVKQIRLRAIDDMLGGGRVIHSSN
jgi:hypothetical protein